MRMSEVSKTKSINGDDDDDNPIYFRLKVTSVLQ